jgi:glutaredoxin
MYIVYSKPQCKFCEMAKTLLDSKSLHFVEINIDVGQPKDGDKTYIGLSELKLKFPNVRSAPIITRDGIFVGGYGELLKVV